MTADIVEFMRGFAEDHEPDGWPAIKMRQVTELCDMVESLRQRVAELEDTHAYENLIKYGNSHPEMYKTELDLVKEQLAASEKERDGAIRMLELEKESHIRTENQLAAVEKERDKLNAALESWSFSQKEKMAPDYLIDELEFLQDKLKGVVLS